MPYPLWFKSLQLEHHHENQWQIIQLNGPWLINSYVKNDKKYLVAHPT